MLALTNGGAGINAGDGRGGTTQPPYSVTLIIAHAGAFDGDAPHRPGAPTATAVSDQSATLAWAPDPRRPHVHYAVYRQSGTVTEKLGETPGTSLHISGLTAGTRYTVNVVAREDGSDHDAS